jgi:hypothetical protein
MRRSWEIFPARLYQARLEKGSPHRTLSSKVVANVLIVAVFHHLGYSYSHKPLGEQTKSNVCGEKRRQPNASDL